MACAVVARPDPKWGETPLAFVELRAGAEADAGALIAHCKSLLAGYKVPRVIRFEAIPKTSTGKIQNQLRQRPLGRGDRRERRSQTGFTPFVRRDRTAAAWSP
jgi:fatty-acyl-CoA synthase